MQSITRLRLKGCCAVARRYSTTLQSQSEVSMTAATKSLAAGIACGRRDALARAITLIESTRADHKAQSALLMNWLTQNRCEFSKKDAFSGGSTLRLGVAGPPGAGKSTFIEALGMRLVHQNHRVAVVPVDPSSHISGGSILGDKTRMEELSKSDAAYVRASPTRGVLGGIAEHTADVIGLCEAAGYDVVIVESVGLGQSEVDIDLAVDMLVMLVPPGGGDGLQASKKGIMEAADLVVVNKADGHLLQAAQHTKADYTGAMAFIRLKHASWQPKVLMMSAQTKAGLDEVEEHIRKFHQIMVANGQLQSKRVQQAVHWMWGQLRRQLIAAAEDDERVQRQAAILEGQLGAGRITPRAAAEQLFGTLRRHGAVV